MEKETILDRLFINYRLWGIAAICSFLLFMLLLSFAVFFEGANIVVVFIVLLFGFLWIGATSLYRHSFILLKRYIGKEVSILEFLSTQLVVFLFPFTYGKVKKEVDLYRGKILSEKK